MRKKKSVKRDDQDHVKSLMNQNSREDLEILHVVGGQGV